MHLARTRRMGLFFAALACAAGAAAAATVTITPVPTLGRVTSSPSGLSCGNGGTGACSAAFVNGSTLSLTATPVGSLNRFKEWRVTISGTTGTSTANPLVQTVPSASASVNAVFVTVPGAPALGNPTPGNGSATVVFKPSSSGTSPITSYTVTSTPGGITATGASSPITVTGLTNGTSYTFNVRATSDAGTGPPSAQSNAVTPGVPPGPPTNVRAGPGNGEARVTFAAPVVTGIPALSSYTATCNPGSRSATGAASPLRVTGLTNGTTYTCSVVASNAVGNSSASQSASVTPGVPNEMFPPGYVPQYGGVLLYISGSPPANNGSPILDYTAVCDPGNHRATAATDPIRIDGLTNEQTYSCSISARNAVGSGPPSPSTTFVLRKPGKFVSPLPPDGYVGRPYSHTFTVVDCGPPCTFRPVGNSGTPGLGLVDDTESDGNAYLVGIPTIRGSYRQAVYASFPNETTAGPPYQEFTINISTVPGAPAITGATPGTGSVSISFVAPADDGGTPITSYTATSNPGGVIANGTASPIVVGGLTGGTQYTFTVHANNAAGAGAESSPSNSVTPAMPAASVPGAPTNVTAVPGNASASVAFSPPASDGGSPITSYTATSNPGGVSANANASPIVVGGLTNGTLYTFTVRANNAAGSGLDSSPSNAVTPRAAASLPEAPVISRAVAGDARATLEFAARGDGGSAITSFIASCNPGNRTATGSASPIAITGLTNRQSYSCTVSAVNATGIGPASAVVSVTPVAPRLPVTVQANITPTTASATATFSPAPEDAGRTANVYVFAIAPSTLVANVVPGSLSWEPHGAKAGSVECVLAQLGANGQLQGASIASLQAAISNVVIGQSQAVTLLNNVPTPNVSGATFYVGYGETSGAMIVNGVTSNALTVPGPVTCQPQPPQTGWWWNPAEDGRGFSIEVRGNNLFFAAFLYDTSGRSTWYVSSGAVSVDGSLYSGDLYGARGGQTLGGPYPGRPELINEGPITLAFHTANEGTLVWPGGIVPIQRFNIVQDGLAADPAPNTPESGWWWNEQESGRGFFLEWQGGTLDIAGYMYDDQGNSVWYLTVGEMATRGGNFFTGSWWSYGNGQTLTGAWKPNARLSTTVAPMTITFSGPDTALMTLPNGRTTSLRRHRF